MPELMLLSSAPERGSAPVTPCVKTPDRNGNRKEVSLLLSQSAESIENQATIYLRWGTNGSHGRNILLEKIGAVFSYSLVRFWTDAFKPRSFSG